MNKQSIILLIFIGLSVLLYIAFIKYYEQKFGYIEIKTVFENFSMKKELEAKYKNTENLKKKILDSLQFEIAVLESSLQKTSQSNAFKNEIEKYNKIKEEYFLRRKQYEEDALRLTETYDNQIIEQMNQYIKQYGEENNYTYIFGNANGSIMYAKESENITKKVIDYINIKYQGK